MAQMMFLRSDSSGSIFFCQPISHIKNLGELPPGNL